MKNNKQKKSVEQPPSLLMAIVNDLLIRHWLVSGLALLLVISSMQLAKTSHQARKLTAEFQKLRKTEQDQQVAFESLRLELTTLSEADRISSLAKKELGMVEVTTKNEKVISL
ncbi:cell division protein FtsL [Aliikangiella marina]|uniref:Cell division protein FtsL n=1 Tax=Aliikangiella marina TaxID=1712262 RepID=A0A545TDI8_9GAMM|nr:cell division protein FtsL [Aliikangiella marina]TQV75275.1 cell division protein FtsL [Aliikangiella marina]